MGTRMMARRVVASLAIALVVASCSSGATGDGSADGYGGELQANRWVLRSSAANGVVGGALVVVPPTLYVDADFRAGRVKGFSGCNDYDAVYRSGGRLLLISMPLIIRKTCGSAELDTFEAGFQYLLQQSRFYGIRNDVLTIRAADLSVILVFDAGRANPLLGSWVVESYADAGGAAVQPIDGTDPAVVFRFARVTGTTGCNTFDGPYTTNGNVAAIGPLASTQMACAEDVMVQESALLAALQGVSRVQPRGARLELTNARGDVLLRLARPFTVEPTPGPSASAQPSASASPSASPSASAAPSPTATPSASPTAAPTASPTAAPTAAPTGTPAPTVVPPASLPPVANCALNVVVGGVSTQIATIVYPADWNTVAAPPTLACRYFDPEPITVPADPTTLTTAVMVKADLTITYADALAAATNPTAWNVLAQAPVTVAGLPATRIEATSTAGTPGYPVGVTRYAYLIDAGRPVWFETSGTVGDAAYDTNKSVVDLMASQSTLIVVAVPL
jgi:heat shock protein HslJ